MKINTLFTVLGFTLLAGSIAYSLQQLTSEKQTQAQILLDKQTNTIKTLQTQINTVTEQANSLESILDNQQQNHQVVLTNNKKNISNKQDNPDIALFNEQLTTLTETVKKQAKELQELQNLRISINQASGSNGLVATENVAKTTEEIDAEADAQIEQINQNMENYWQQQAVETAWSQNIEETARTSLATEQGLALNEISCKTDVCRLEITTTGESETDPSDWVMDHIETSEVHTQAKINEDGSESFIIYLSKQGSSLLANIN